ncbi:EAL domain-containing protein [Kineococcus gynurae]|uniref:EAL domain-containing protein n=1 Tax=Kineococcus gynurae TaxID=452979 RepID=UPI0036D34A85
MTARVGWRRRIDALLAQPAAFSLALQPVVDVAARRVAGYEALGRFGVAIEGRRRGPGEWFAAAAHLGRAAELDALVLQSVLQERVRLPHGTFLTVNVTPDALLTPAFVAQLLAGERRGLVLEVTEHAEVDSADLVGPLDAWRDRGGLVALDDVGAGHSGLLRLALTRPDLIKIDLQLIRGLESDLMKRSVVQLVGECAARLDAWVVAEGVETVAELDVLRTMGVPLVQGFLLARPRGGFARLDPGAAALLAGSDRSTPGPRTADEPGPTGPVSPVSRLARRPRTTLDLAVAHAVAEVEGCTTVVLDDRDVPVAVVLPDVTGSRAVTELTCVDPGTRVGDVAVRAVSRPTGRRFDPVVCTDETGRFVGLVGVEDLVIDLAAAQVPVEHPPVPRPEVLHPQVAHPQVTHPQVAHPQGVGA